MDSQQTTTSNDPVTTEIVVPDDVDGDEGNSPRHVSEPSKLIRIEGEPDSPAAPIDN